MKKINKKPASLFSYVLLFMLSIMLSHSALAATYDSTGNGNYHASGTWTLVSGTGGAIPGANDIANIQSGHTLVANNPININTLNIHSNANLTLLNGGNSITANAVNVYAAAVLQGFDNPNGMGGRVDILNSGSGFALLNEGLIRGGHPGGTLFISTANGSDLPCANNGASITGNNGLFLGGNDYGGVYIVSETLQMTDTLIAGGSGNAPNMASGPVYMGGIGITLNGTTNISSGTNTATPGNAGSVKIVASNCNNGQGTLLVDSGVNITVGSPIVAACPGVLLYAGFSSTVLGTVGPMGSGSCIYWDPPHLALAGQAQMQAENIDIAGESLTTAGLTPGVVALDAQENLTISVDVLDLTGLEPDSPYFKAGHEIIVNAGEILVDEGTDIHQFMEPAPQIQDNFEVQNISVTPAVNTTVRQGNHSSLPIQLVSVGNTDISKLVVEIKDQQGWLVGGSYQYNGPLNAGQSLNYNAVIQVPAGTEIGAKTQLTISVLLNGEPVEVQPSVFTVID